VVAAEHISDLQVNQDFLEDRVAALVRLIIVLVEVQQLHQDKVIRVVVMLRV
jgi:hypothetical protein